MLYRIVPKTHWGPIQGPSPTFLFPRSCQQWQNQSAKMTLALTARERGRGGGLTPPIPETQVSENWSGGGGYYANQGSRKCPGHVPVGHTGREWQ